MYSNKSYVYKEYKAWRIDGIAYQMIAWILHILARMASQYVYNRMNK